MGAEGRSLVGSSEAVKHSRSCRASRNHVLLALLPLCRERPLVANRASAASCGVGEGSIGRLSGVELFVVNIDGITTRQCNTLANALSQTTRDQQELGTLICSD